MKELINKIFKNAKIDRAKTQNHEDQDSDMLPSDVKMKPKKDADKEKKKIEPVQNQEAVPLED